MSIRIIYQTFVHILQLTFANKGSIISFVIKENRKLKRPINHTNGIGVPLI